MKYVVCTQMIQEWCCTKTYAKREYPPIVKTARNIEEKKGKLGSGVVGWLMVGKRPPVLACSAFARPRLANNKAARLTTTTSVRSLPFLHPFIISPFSFSFSFPALPSYYSASSIMFAFRVPIYGPTERPSADKRTMYTPSLPHPCALYRVARV